MDRVHGRWSMSPWGYIKPESSTLQSAVQIRSSERVSDLLISCVDRVMDNCGRHRPGGSAPNNGAAGPQWWITEVGRIWCSGPRFSIRSSPTAS
jgi:hypothetical protein